MTVYLDSSALVKLYVKEFGSPAVARYVRRLTEPLPFSHLHEVEVKNGLRLKVFRNEATRAAALASLKLIDEDLASGLLRRPDLSWPEVFRAAGELSAAHSMTFGCRSLDLLHVALARLLQVTDFLTFDTRQAAIASKVGLRVVPA